jgi:hypothetical protein
MPVSLYLGDLVENKRLKRIRHGLCGARVMPLGALSRAVVAPSAAPGAGVSNCQYLWIKIF